MPKIGLGDNLVRMALENISTIPVAGESDFTIANDVDSAAFPSRCVIRSITVQPSASCSWLLEIFGKATRIRTGGDADYSLVFEHTESPASDDPWLSVLELSEIPYQDMDSGSPSPTDALPGYTGSLYGRITNLSGSPAAFSVLVGFYQ